MEQLLDFLGRYYFLVVIAAGLVYTLFFKKSPLEKDAKPKPSSRMPNFGGGGLPGPTVRRVPPRATGWPAERSSGSPRELGGESEAGPGADWRELRAPEPVAPPAASAELSPGPAAVPAPAAAGRAAAPAPEAAARAGLAASLAALDRGGPAAPAGSATGGLPAADWSRAELARAVVMAEVLGPPRARKPFRRR
jgi:hypothetical protein